MDHYPIGMSAISTSLVEALAAHDAQPNRDFPILDAVEGLIALAVGDVRDAATVGLSSIIEFVSVAHGFHDAATRAQEVGNEARARELHSLGQLFLIFATNDVETLAALTLDASEPRTIH